jgi:hypothetical protein
MTVSGKHKTWVSRLPEIDLECFMKFHSLLQKGRNMGYAVNFI